MVTATPGLDTTTSFGSAVSAGHSTPAGASLPRRGEAAMAHLFRPSVVRYMKAANEPTALQPACPRSVPGARRAVVVHRPSGTDATGASRGTRNGRRGG